MLRLEICRRIGCNKNKGIGRDGGRCKHLEVRSDS
jgi:hypothetical protein